MLQGHKHKDYNENYLVKRGHTLSRGILMELKDLRQDTLVEHPELGVGKIARLEPEQNQAVISFRSEPEFRMPIKDAISRLETRPGGGLAAYLYADPEKVLSWVNAGQLRLVGAALADLGGAGRTKDLQERLEKPVLSLVSVKWTPWWTNKVQPSLKESEYFEFQKPHTYRLKEGVLVGEIPVESLVGGKKATPKINPNQDVSEVLKQLRESHAAELKEQRDSHTAELIRQRDAHAADLKQQREAHAVDLGKQREAYSADLKRQRDSFIADLRQQRETHDADLKQQRDSHDAELERRQRKEEALQSQIKTLRAEIAANREESRMEIRRDMLEIMAETLEILHRQKGHPARLLRDVEAGLKLALQAGEAQFYGQADQTVEYNPELHEALEHIARGEAVTIIHPGVLIPGIKTGNYILLKALVKR